MDMRDTIGRLLERADPEGAVHAKLTKILAAVNDGVFIGPAYQAFIDRLTGELAGFECKHVLTDGTCPVIKDKCPHTGYFQACEFYEQAKPERADGYEARKGF